MAAEKDQHDAHIPRTSPTGAGAEASEGIHSADGDRSEAHSTGLTGKPTGRSTRKDEDRSKYGGGSREEDDEGQRAP